MKKTKKGLLYIRSVLVALVVMLMVGSIPLSVQADDEPFGVGAPISTMRGFNPDTGEMQRRWTIVEDFPWAHEYPSAFYTGSKLDPNKMPPYWYEAGHTVTINQPSDITLIPALGEGQHYYTYSRVDFPIGKWVVAWTAGRCIHSGPEYGGFWGGIIFGETGSCGKAYPSGWFAYCAECGQKVENAFVYATEESVSKITKYNTSYEYYYICPNPDCGGLENTGFNTNHDCRRISWNAYKIVYEKNATGVRGVTMDSIHIYNNGYGGGITNGDYGPDSKDGKPMYEGSTDNISVQTKLNMCGYELDGYTFVGWNTKPDGTGTAYADEAEIYNLTSKHYKKEDGKTDNPDGIIHLYAQWVETKNTLKIDAKGGTYDGQSVYMVTDGGYGTTYYADPSKVVGRSDYKVKFEPNGGTVTGSNPMDVPNLFLEWQRSNSASTGGKFKGGFKNNTYTFKGPGGQVDVLEALYELDSITLPPATRDGYSFGGWFEDSTCQTTPVGFGGGKYRPDTSKCGPDGSITLYAKWTNLKLEGIENYIANGGKGASDLKWTDGDNSGIAKAYNLYRSLDQFATEAKVIGTGVLAPAGINKSYDFNAAQPSRSYTIPSTGYYTIKAFGADGADYWDGTNFNAGGKGGIVEAQFFLQQGDILTITIGGKDGTGGGAPVLAVGNTNGGGATTVTKTSGGTTTTLVVAGGGGGASILSPGGIGGSQDAYGLRGDEVSTGQSGIAGGGGGYRGGLAGSYNVHTCFAGEGGCLVKHEHSVEQGCYSVTETVHHCPSVPDNYRCGICGATIGKFIEYDNGSVHFKQIAAGNLNCPHLVSNDGKQCYSASNRAGAWTDCNANQVAHGPGHDGGPGCNNPTVVGGHQACGGYYRIVFSNGVQDGGKRCVGSWWCPFQDNKTETYTLICTRDEEYHCSQGYVSGTVLSANQSFGGSSYVDSSCINSTMSHGANTLGNGHVDITANVLGLNTGYEKKGIESPDLVAPDKIDEASVKQDALNAYTVKITFDRPEDHGTMYWWRCESVNVSSGTKIADSNKVSTELITGVVAYRFVYDTTPTRVVTLSGSSTLAAPEGSDTDSITLNLAFDVQYLHIAPLDKAGNLGQTIDIKLDKGIQNFPIETAPITISSTVGGRDYKSVYTAADGTVYVNADGSKPFLLTYTSTIDGTAALDYQIDTQYFSVNKNTPGTTQRFITTVPRSTDLVNIPPIASSSLSKRTEGSALISATQHAIAKRLNGGNQNIFSQGFLISSALNGQKIAFTPSASALRDGADAEEDVVMSEWSADVANSIYVIPDAEPPVITNNQGLDSISILNKDTIGDPNVVISAVDALSGLKNLTVTILNQDNGSTKSYTGAGGTVNFTVDPNANSVFAGDFLIKVTASDNVGNTSTVQYGMEEFAMDTNLTHAGYNPTGRTQFLRGEKANLSIITRGYAEKVVVTLPAELQPGNESVPLEFNYPAPRNYRELESVLFDIPISCPAGSYILYVTSYKNGVQIEHRPVLITIEPILISGEVHVRVK